MWQRFTERARRVVFFSQEEAGRFGENYVNTEHLLLGLVRENDSVAARILDRMGVSLGRIRSEIERQATRGVGRLGQDMQLTPLAQRMLELCYDEARMLSNNYIGTEHLLLGLIRDEEGLAGRVLTKLGVELERTRREVLALQDTETGLPPPPEKPVESDYARDFAAQFEKLSAEQRNALLGDGIPLRELPAIMWTVMQQMLVQNVKGGSFILDPNGIVRVNVIPSEGATHYTVTAKTSFLINLLVKDEPKTDETKEDETTDQ